MSEEKDESTMAEEQAMIDAGHHDGGTEEIEGVPPQVNATPGMPHRQAVDRRQARVREIMHTLPPAAQEAIRADLEGTHRYASHEPGEDTAVARHHSGDDELTTSVLVTNRSDG
jgi:phospholipid/cholesterol/gamma-HCH transport system ATP-binding protein